MYKNKYLKYKNKYLNLIAQHGGGTIYIQNDNPIKLDNIDDDLILNIKFLEPNSSIYIPMEKEQIVYEIRAITSPQTNPLYKLYINDKLDDKIYKYRVNFSNSQDLYTINIMFLNLSDKTGMSHIISLKISETDLGELEILKEGKEHHLFIYDTYLKKQNHYIITKYRDIYKITSDTNNSFIKSKQYFFTLKNVRQDDSMKRKKFQEETKEPEIERESKSMN